LSVIFFLSFSSGQSADRLQLHRLGACGLWHAEQRGKARSHAGGRMKKLDEEAPFYAYFQCFMARFNSKTSPKTHQLFT
jgi:hypothetical protein